MKTKLTIGTKWVFSLYLILQFITIGHAQSTVFSEDFNSSAGTSFTTVTGAIGTSTRWNMSRSGTDFGAKINSGILTLTNDASSSTNANGWVMGYTNIATNFNTPYSSVLNSNSGMITWTFNMRQIRTNPGGFSSDKYGVAFILAGTAGTSNSSGTGYAVVLGNSESTDPIKLVRYTAGIKTFTTLLTSNTTGLKDFGSEYISVKITFTPGSNTWQMSLRNDGTTAFTDPLTGTLTSQGTVVNSSYTATSLPIMGYFWNASTSSSQTAFLDNLKVSVVVPSLTSISPSSKVAGSGAFTLTVNGSNFVSGTSTVKWNGTARTTTYVSPTQLTAAILASDISTTGSASITVVNGTAISNSLSFLIDAPNVPALSLSTNSIPSFSTISGTASAASTYTISGSDLTANATVTAPNNFELSSDGTTYSSSLNLVRNGTTLVGQPLTIYVRVKSSAPSGILSGSITHTSTGATTKTITVSATVMAIQPTTLSSSISFSAVTSESFTINWTNGNGSNHLVLIKAGSAVNSSPVDATTYSAMTTFGTGSELGTGIFTVYNGSSSSVTVTGLTAATAYYVALYEFNGSTSTENYSTSATTSNRTTLNSPIGWQIYTTNEPTRITFDSTVDGVNEDSFQGDGFSPTPANGLLNSNAWAISGFSDGSVSFGGTSTEGLDFDRGISTGTATTGGVYAFATSDSNFSLGVHPSTGDFAPGTITLRFQNQTGNTITSLNIGYTVYVNNSQNASNNLNFSYSSDNSSYTTVNGLVVNTPTSADLNTGWTAYYRVLTITGISLPTNNYYYLRWTGAATSGSGNYDDISLDDISLVANPTTHFVSFEGTAASLVVQGNTQLSNATTITQDVTINSGKLNLNGKTLTLGGTLTNTIPGGITTSNGSLVFNGSVDNIISLDQTTVGTTNVLSQLTVATTELNTVSIDNPIVLNAGLTIAMEQTLDIKTFALTGSLSSITNNGTLATQNTSSLPLPSNKNWNGTGKVLYNASASQSIVSGTYHGLTIDNTAGGIAMGALTVNGILHLPNANPSSTLGGLDMNSYELTMGLSATNVGLGDVIGKITRNNPVANTTYTFGNPATTFTLTGTGDTPAYITMIPSIGSSSCCETPAPNPAPILRYYEILLPITNPGLYTSVNLHYLDSELNGNDEDEITTADYDIPTPIASGGSGKGWTTHDEHGRAQYDINTTGAKFVGWANVPISYFIYVPGQTGDPGYPHDWRTIFSLYTHSNSAYKKWKGTEDSNWNNGANWLPEGAVDSNSRIIIPDAATLTHLPVLPAEDITIQSITIGKDIPLIALGDFTITATGVMGGGAWEDVNGSFNPNGHTVTFTGIGATLIGTTSFYDVVIENEASIINVEGNHMKINHEVIKNGSGEWNPNLFNTTVEYNGSNQTILANGSGSYYHHLILSGSGSKTLPNTTMTIDGTLTLADSAIVTANAPLAIIGNFIIGEDATFNTGAYNQSIKGSFENNGTFIASTDNNFTFNGNSYQSISGSQSIVFQNLNINNTNEVELFNTTSVSKALTLSKGTLSIDNTTLDINGTLSQLEGFLDVSTNTTLSFNGSTAVTLPSNLFVSNPVIKTLTLNNNSGITLGNQDITIVNTLNLSNGILTISNSNLTLGSTATISVTNPNASKMIIVNQLGQLRKVLTSNSSFLFPIGDATSSLEYSPINIGIYGSDYENAYVGVTVANQKHGNNNSSTNYLNRYWTITQSGITNCTLSVNASYTSGDIVGSEINIAGAQLEGEFNQETNPWVKIGQLSNFTITSSEQDIPMSNQIVITGISAILPAIVVTSPTITTCYNTDVTLSTTNTADGNVIYDWAPNDAMVNEYSASPTIHNVTSPTTYTLTIRDGNGITATTDIQVNVGATTTWNGSWSNGAPSSSSSVILSSNYTANENITTCNLTVTNNANVIIAAGKNVHLNGALQVVSGTFTLQNNANLFQESSFTNSGSIIVKRTSSALKRLDYTLWSSPVDGQLIQSFSPQTTYNRFYTYNTYTNLYDVISNPYTSTFEAAKGYLIRIPNNHPTTATTWTGSFTGVAHNGDYVYPLEVSDDSHRFNLVGNPYPSPIDMATFVSENSASITGTLYFWRKTNNASNPSYCTWLDDTFVDNGENQVIDPNGIIRTGQGFFVESLPNATEIVFHNSQRVADNSNQFFKSSKNQERHRIWLNLSNNSNAFSQMEVGYIEGASNSLDTHDGKFINDGVIGLYSIVENKNLVIQSRVLPFDASDEVPLGYYTTAVGSYTIAIDHLDGLFTSNQSIILKDLELGTYQDLTQGSYTFDSEIGTFTNRFVIVYSTPLSTYQPEFASNSTLVYRNENSLVIHTSNTTIDSVIIYDISGRVLFQKDEINSDKVILNPTLSNQIILVQIKTASGNLITKKVLY
jgi:hypothetical protein